MYSRKDNVNILTALLVANCVKRAVVCPGSRNAPIVHNLHVCPDIICHPVTDERSAGFYALGMALSTGQPVAVCVTSGTALLNLQPAVAEAFYRHVGLIVISADRPQAWIGQLDGQTLPQPGALGGFVGKAVSLPEPSSDIERWHCNRLVNEALITAKQGQPVHINVPISEPLFLFDNVRLPDERVITYHPAPFTQAPSLIPQLLSDYGQARRPMVVIGQCHYNKGIEAVIGQLSSHAVVLSEALANPSGGQLFDGVLHRSGDDRRLLPDFLLYCGDTVVSKRLKHFLRTEIKSVWEVSSDGQIHDTFRCLKHVMSGQPMDVLPLLAQASNSHSSEYVALWQKELKRQEDLLAACQPAYSEMAAVKCFEESVRTLDAECYVHYANSSAVRLANIFARHYVWCNRGVNGIEGSLSTAAGFSLTTNRKVFCVIGDLSFFYDQNALWNTELGGNLRILLLNNGCGGIFRQLPGLSGSTARDHLVAASHQTTAQGICRQNGVAYLCAGDMESMRQGIDRLINDPSERPVLLEVQTNADDDARAWSDLLN